MININPKKYPILASKPLEQWHKEMWVWLAQHPQSSKKDYVNMTFTDDEIALLGRSWNCFACIFAGRIKPEKSSKAPYTFSCEFCPICNFGNHGLSCCGGLFDKYATASAHHDYDDVYEAAMQIANLEWRIK